MFTINWSNSRIDSNPCEGIPPSRRGYHTAIVDGLKLMIFGGFNDKKVFNDFYSFDHINQKWLEQHYINNRKDEIPFPRERCTLVKIYCNKMILFGGYFCSADLEFEENYNDLYCLDLV